MNAVVGLDGAPKRRGREEVHVLRETVDQPPGLGEAGAALEDGLSREVLGHGAQHLGHEVVLFHELLGEARNREVLRRLDHELVEVGVLEEPHLACHDFASLSARKGPKSNRLNGLRLSRRALSAAGGCPASSPIAPAARRG